MIILFGGAFDPPHLGHQQVVDQLLGQNLANEVWYVPAKLHAFNKQMLNPRHRLAMLKMILHDRVRVESFELNKEGVSYTYDTLKYLAKQYPQEKFAFVIGSDNLPDFYKWGDTQNRTPSAMLKEFPFYVYPRSGYPMKPLYPGMTPLSQMSPVNISSTQVRTLLSQGQNITGLVDPQVERYIKEHQLYA